MYQLSTPKTDALRDIDTYVPANTHLNCQEMSHTAL